MLETSMKEIKDAYQERREEVSQFNEEIKIVIKSYRSDDIRGVMAKMLEIYNKPVGTNNG